MSRLRPNQYLVSSARWAAYHISSRNKITNSVALSAVSSYCQAWMRLTPDFSGNRVTQTPFGSPARSTFS